MPSSSIGRKGVLQTRKGGSIPLEGTKPKMDVWCNGSMTDCRSVRLGSTPCISANIDDYTLWLISS